MQPGQQHSIFGDPKKVVTEEFVRRGYLIYKPVPRSWPVEYSSSGDLSTRGIKQAESHTFVAGA